MRNTLRKIFKSIKYFWSSFTAAVSRIMRRISRPAFKQAGNARVGSPVSCAAQRRGVRHKAAFEIKAFFSSLFKKLGKRGIRIIAVSGAAVVVIAVVLCVALAGTGGAQVAGAAGGTTPAQNGDAAAAVSGESSGATESAQSAGNGDSQQTSAVQYPQSDTVPAAAPVSTTAPEEVELVPGCHDGRIMEIQERLMELGYLGEDEPTDYYGPGTQYALQLFQRKHSLQVDGILGEQTQMMLFSDEATPYTVKLGDSGTDVESIQERLKELHYFTGDVTGEFGERTEAAVISFQRRNGLSPDGNVGENTREVLYSEDARPASGGSSSGGSSGGSGSGGSTGGGSTIATWEPDSNKVEALISFAESLLGSRYVRGGKGPNVFDCSGFVYYCLNQTGYSIGYMTSSGWSRCGLPKVTSMSDMRRGDIICFRGHVGIYLGNGRMIDASSTAGEIRISTTVLTSAYWKRNFICARRVF